MKVFQTVSDRILFDIMNIDLMYSNTSIFDSFNTNYYDMTDEKVEMKRFSEKLVNQLANININDVKELYFDRSNLCHNNNYSMFDSTIEIDSLSDLPSINRIINNHYKYYLLPDIEKDIGLFTIDCKFRPLLIRSDGLSVVSIQHIRTEEVGCNPPNHEIPGINLLSRPDNLYKQSLYLPLCLIDLSQYDNVLYIHEFNEEIEQNEIRNWKNMTIFD